MIKIKCGTCGTSQGYVTAADGELRLSADEEKRLVSRGVAEYVTKPIISADAESGNEKPICPEYSVDMKADYLRSLLEQFEIPYKQGMTKADMVAALDEVLCGEAVPEAYVQEPVL